VIIYYYLFFLEIAGTVGEYLVKGDTNKSASGQKMALSNDATRIYKKRFFLLYLIIS